MQDIVAMALFQIQEHWAGCQSIQRVLIGFLFLIHSKQCLWRHLWLFWPPNLHHLIRPSYKFYCISFSSIFFYKCLAIHFDWLLLQQDILQPWWRGVDPKGLVDVYMLKHIFTNWRKVPYADKVVIQTVLHERYAFVSIFQFFVRLKCTLYH